MAKQGKLKQVIKEKGLLQQHVAMKTGINKWKMSKIVNGHIRPTQDEIERIASYLEEPVIKIFNTTICLE